MENWNWQKKAHQKRLIIKSKIMEKTRQAQRIFHISSDVIINFRKHVFYVLDDVNLHQEKQKASDEMENAREIINRLIGDFINKNCYGFGEWTRDDEATKKKYEKLNGFVINVKKKKK